LFSEYFSPVKFEIIDYVNKLDNNQLGSKLKINGRDNLNSFESLDIVIFSVNEYRFNSGIRKSFNANKDFRKKLYSLYYGNWNLNIYDLGDLENGNLVSDTQFALSKILEFFSKNKILVITIGGSQNLLFDIYSSLKETLQKINLVSVDNKIDFSNNNESFLQKIIMDENNRLANFSNIGYQKHLTSVPENKLLDKMYFESINLGKIKYNVAEAEPVLRDSDIVSFNINSVKAGELNNAHQYPNGLSSYELCSLSRFSGLSSRVNIVSYFENWDLSIMNSLLAESTWYVIDGYATRINENPLSDSNDFIYYHIELDNYKFKFYRSKLSDRWWVEFLNDEIISIEKDIISCTFDDYNNCKNSVIPERILTRLKNKIT
tara:strand:- start:1080 stop:2207 length:1128 start_codon:yes stop_codon:yes gene_type:complete